jgi:N-methylhydantoinase B
VVFRQFSCPGCWTALYSAVVPSGNGTPVTTPLAGGLVTA